MDSLQRHSIRDPRHRGGRVLAVLACLLLGAPAFGLQVPLLDGPTAQDRPVLWEPSQTLVVGESLVLLGEEVGLSLDPNVKLQTGPMVPGGILAPFALRTNLRVSVRANPGLRPEPMRVRRPVDSQSKTPDLPLLGPGAEFLLWSEDDPTLGWGYLRVLEVNSGSARVEFASCMDAVEELVRDPVGLISERGAELSWTSFAFNGGSVADAPRYRVERRGVGQSPWATVADGITVGADGIYRMVDQTARQDPATVFEYRVTRAGTPAGELPKIGHIGSLVRGHGFSEDPVTVAPGLRVNLISSIAVEAGQAAHVELGRSAPGSVLLKPLEDVRLGGATQTEGQARLSWRLPDPFDASWLPGKAVRVKDGQEVPFLLPNGLAGRLRIREIGSERWVLHRQLSYDGTGLLPRPPAAPLKKFAEAASDSDEGSGRLLLSLAAPHPNCGVNPRDVALVLEHQLEVGAGEWEVLAETGPGTTSFDLDDAFGDGAGGRRPLARLRLRYSIPFGPTSAPGASFDMLTAGANSALRLADLDAALSRLSSEDFPDRVAAGAFLRAMGGDARPALEALAQESATSPAGLAAVELLRELDEQGGGGVRFQAELRALALASLRGRRAASSESEDASLDHWLGDMPPGLAAETARQRAHALLLAIDRACRGGAGAGPRGTVAEDCERALAWAEAAASADSDEGVRWIARIVSEVGLRPSLASFESLGPAWLLPPSRRSSPERLDFGWGDQPGTAEELRWQLEARPELASLRLGPALARLHAALAPAEQLSRIYGGPSVQGEEAGAGSDGLRDEPPRLFDYDSSVAELVLRLVERARVPGADPVLLAAAKSLLPGARLTLEAWRSVSDRRLATPSADTVPRERIELEGNRLGDLAALLTELDVEAGVDIVLGAGSWTDRAEESDGTSRPRLGQTTLTIRSDDVRLIAKGDGPVRIHAGLRVYGNNVVLQNLVIDHAQGGAITVLDGGHVVALGCELLGMGTVMHLQNGTAEIIECELGGADPANLPATAVRLILASRLHARASLFDAGSLFVSSEAEAWLDRCVLDARSRMLVQGQENGQLNVRESLLRGEGSGLFRVSSGLLVGTVIDVPRDPLGRLPQSLQDGGIRVSPRFFHLVQEGQEVPPAMRLDVEPLAVPLAGATDQR